MKTIFVAVLIALVCSFTHVSAADIAIEPIRIMPQDAAAGEPVTILVFVYNKTTDTTTYTIETKAADTRITTSVLTLAGGSAKTIEIPWKMPEIKTTVTASIVSALGKDKKDIMAMHGMVGALSVGEKSSTTVGASTEVAKNAFEHAKMVVESFRLKQATHFTELRDAVRVKLGLEKGSTPTVVSDADAFKIKSIDNPGDYAMLMLYSALASFFSQALLFYALSVLVVFLVLRFFFRLFI